MLTDKLLAHIIEQVDDRTMLVNFPADPDSKYKVRAYPREDGHLLFSITHVDPA